MADEGDFLQRLLQDIRSEIRDVRTTQKEHGKRFDTLERMIREWQETTATSLGLAGHANMRIEAMSSDIEDIKDRLRELEGRH